METKGPKTYEEHLAEYGMTPADMERYIDRQIAKHELRQAVRQTGAFRLSVAVIATLDRFLAWFSRLRSH